MNLSPDERTYFAVKGHLALVSGAPTSCGAKGRRAFDSCTRRVHLWCCVRAVDSLPTLWPQSLCFSCHVRNRKGMDI
eukprot:1160641-Pelagomonas_calceolata.AAC.15